MLTAMGELTDGLTRVLSSYRAASSEPFGGHPLAVFLRRDLRAATAELVDPSYTVEGSGGRGRWADTPWVAIFDPQETTSAEHGVYIVFLFRNDGAGLYLTLGQGATEIMEAYGRKYAEVLRDKARFYASLLTGRDTSGFERGPIDLGGGGRLTRGYEAGAILARFYAAQSLTSDEDVRLHTTRLIDLYAELLASKDAVQGEAQPADADDPIPTGIEGLRYRWHFRAERNRTLANAAKRYHGDTCQVCGFNFRNRYGDIGAGYIEAHHLTPVSQLNGRAVEIDPKRDYAVVCPNCHRMLHTDKPPLTPAQLRSRLS